MPYTLYECDNTCPVGIFDSGLGGLTVQKELIKQLPLEHTVYFGDSGRSPYGTKSKETIIHFAMQDASFLLSQKVKMIVIACNTASAHAYKNLSESIGVPVIEVVTPGAKAAINSTINGRIGVIGTSATVESNVYHDAIKSEAEKIGRASNVNIFQKSCPLFVGLAEEGWWDNEVAFAAANKYLLPLKDEGVDTLVLGCTHYPLLQKVIGRVMGDNVKLINSAGEVVKTISKVMEEKKLFNNQIKEIPRKRLFYTSDSEEKFKELGSVFLDMNIETAKKIDIEKY